KLRYVIERTASPTDRTCDNRTPIWRGFATICSGLCFCWGIPTSSPRRNSLLQGGPIFRGADQRLLTIPNSATNSRCLDSPDRFGKRETLAPIRAAALRF